MLSAAGIHGYDDAVKAITSVKECALLQKKNSLRTSVAELLLLVTWNGNIAANHIAALNKKLLEIENLLYPILVNIPIGWCDDDRRYATQGLKIHNIILALKWIYKVELKSELVEKVDKLSLISQERSIPNTRTRPWRLSNWKNALGWDLLVNGEEKPLQKKNSQFEDKIKYIVFSEQLISEFYDTNEGIIKGELTAGDKKTLRSNLKRATLSIFSWVVNDDNLPFTFFDSMDLELNSFIEDIASEEASLRKSFIEKEIAKIALWFRDQCITIFNTTEKWKAIARKKLL